MLHTSVHEKEKVAGLILTYIGNNPLGHCSAELIENTKALKFHCFPAKVETLQWKTKLKL